MSRLLAGSPFFGAFATLAAYGAGLLLQRRFKRLSPLLTAVALLIALLSALRVDCAVYDEGAKFVGFLLTPATICLAVPLYERFELLRQNAAAILSGVVSGVLTSCALVLGLSLLFGFSRAEYATFLPKSVTTAIGMGISERLGGIVPVTTAAIILTGILGSLIAEPVCALFRIEEPIARGIAIGSAAHAIGTTRAMELGETEGAMSSLALLSAGIVTVGAAMVFMRLYGA